jgi:hypothetical protein
LALGCGDGVIMKAVFRAIDKLGWNMDNAKFPVSKKASF